MKTISLKMADNILHKMDMQLEENHFSTRTEFIREAIRDKLQMLEKQQFETEIRAFFRKNHDVADEKGLQKAKNDVFEELERRFGPARGNI